MIEELFKRVNKQINNCYNDKGWGMLAINFAILITAYFLLSWSPEIYSWITGKKISDFITPERHQWHMALMNVIVAISIIAAVFRASQLIKHNDWFNQIRNNKKFADQRLDEEIELRKQENNRGKTAIK